MVNESKKDRITAGISEGTLLAEVLDAAQLAERLEAIQKDKAKRAIKVPEKHANIFYIQLHKMRLLGHAPLEYGDGEEIDAEQARVALLRAFREREKIKWENSCTVDLTGPQIKAAYEIVSKFIPSIVESQPFVQGVSQVSRPYIYSKRLVDMLIYKYPQAQQTESPRVSSPAKKNVRQIVAGLFRRTNKNTELPK